MELKPFENKHAARIIEPSEFDPDSFSTINISDGIDSIIGRLKGETKTTNQSYRFDKDKFTVPESKQWLMDHNITWILFEPAEPKYMKQYKSNNTKVKDIDSKQGIVKAYFAVFGNIDSDGDSIEPGAFTKTIMERGPEGNDRIKHFKWHSTKDVPGKLQELGEDEFGAWFISKLSNTTLGRDTLIEYEEGIITEHSHGFEVIKNDKDESNINHIRESKLWEVSSLTAWGANPLTRVDYVKDIKDEKELLKAIENITKYLQVGRFSDSLLSDLEKKYSQLTTIYNSLITKEPKFTPKAGEPNDKEARLKEYYLGKLI